jgi:hypothetical protein
MLKIIGRICYGVAAALGIASIGVEIQAEQQRRTRGLFARPPTQMGMFLSVRALGLALIGKILEDLGRERAAVTPITSFGKSPMTQPQSLRSAFDRGDLYVEAAPDRRQTMSVR